MKIIDERERCDTRCVVTISDIYINHNNCLGHTLITYYKMYLRGVL